ncbi:hypothetical protein GRI40_04725 [Altererythrobacter aerius]|uniref:Uncharacterized protein n=1 Tax=Tsuneonella aeria TaxID=1837929 RepID=A0A6I4TDS5_9SPHN|nr:hypothetical protein [Tsuneonella aeria]MXO74528.1 hypothetical protein [Tsuneonella aeria]
MTGTTRTLAGLSAIALVAACSQDNAPSEKISDVAETVADTVEGSATPTVADGPYAPRNDCREVPGADAFVARFAAAVKARDAQAVAALAAPDVKLDFGGGAGKERLLAMLAAKDAPLWAELDALASLGCGQNEQGGITLPWYAAQAMADVDPGKAMIVTGESVPVRASPSAARAMGTLSWDIVSLKDGLQPGAPFQQIVMSDGKTGFIASDNLRSVLDYRLIASSRDGKWSITSLVKGD